MCREETPVSCLFYYLIGISTTFSFLLKYHVWELAYKLSLHNGFNFFFFALSLSIWFTIWLSLLCFLSSRRLITQVFVLEVLEHEMFSLEVTDLVQFDHSVHWNSDPANKQHRPTKQSFSLTNAPYSMTFHNALMHFPWRCKGKMEVC